MASTSASAQPAAGLDASTTPPLPSIVVPDGFRLHTENTAHILLPDEVDAFLNPIQEFNRDMSVAVIRTWSEQVAREREAKFWAGQKQREKRKEKKAAKRANVGTVGVAGVKEEGNEEERGREEEKEKEDVKMAEPSVDCKPDPSAAGTAREAPEQASGTRFNTPKIIILEALSATGLRSIRYAQEIPLVKHVIANDLSEHAVEAMKRNIELNGLGSKADEDVPGDEASTSKKRGLGKVRVNHGDARALMYGHSGEKTRVDVVDLDPYGTAAPFLDAAVQAVTEGGLLCVTCTDLSVLATNNYPEKCYANYGGVPAKAEYCHEIALRLVLHTISQTAARYGRYIEPLLSLSIDFYVRLFVTIKTAPIQVKHAVTKTSTVYVCSFCQSHYEQSLGRVVEKKNDRTGVVTELFKIQSGPPVKEKCPECGCPLHVAGPMWSGPIHDAPFVDKVLKHLETGQGKYGTAARMKGMLTVAKEELDTLFYFTPALIASHFHTVCPSLAEVASALLNDSHKISRSHACAGSLKTTATRKEVHDVFRSWIKTHPVKLNKLPDSSPSRVLNATQPAKIANFTKHPKSPLPGWKEKLVRYQPNPTPNWGPGSKAPAGTKRKREGDDEQ